MERARERMRERVEEWERVNKKERKIDLHMPGEYFHHCHFPFGYHTPELYT